MNVHIQTIIDPDFYFTIFKTIKRNIIYILCIEKLHNEKYTGELIFMINV